MNAPQANGGDKSLAEYQLDHRYTLEAGRVYLTGSQALVRLPMLQRSRDEACGLNTAGFISGYTGSPLGGYDIALKQALPLLELHHVRFQPGLNEDLGATAVWGSQQVNLIEGARYDGVFGIWYGKGPGVDRSGDALKHGSYAGASAHGGVLVLAGDDHGAKSSTTAHQSDHAFIHFGMPYLNPANVQDYLDFGLYGFALSRYSGCWVGMKCVTDTVESSASVEVDPQRVQIALPADDLRPAEGLNLRWGLTAQAAEIRQYQQRLPAAQAFVRANGLDRVVICSPARRLGIVTSGKAYLDVMQALDELALDTEACRRLGVSVYKVAMPWPLEPVNALAFANGQREVLCVEEKRPIIEDQLAKLLVNAEQRPRLLGKNDEAGQPLISAEGELAPSAVALAIGRRLLALTDDAALAARVALLEQAQQGGAAANAALTRLPSFCAGCPHNTSTTVPEGSIAFGGIGCHGMATFLPERRTPTLFQMGAEGASWIGIAPFSETPHIFQNLGDGTYYHSGLLAIRAAAAAGVNITYKILVNDAIAMTGGQTIEGQMRVDTLTRQVHAEGVSRIAVVSNDLAQYRQGSFAEGVTFHHRDNLESVQRELREVKGVSVIVYDQHCATELRRRRKRGSVPDPDQRMFINPRVCEGCGDCSVQSNCIAIEPVETDFGRKRRINQSACNKDFSCVKGYCPSFVTLRGAKPRRRGLEGGAGRVDIGALVAGLPAPAPRSTATPCNVLITGIGGAGVVTLGALLGMAAHLEGKGCSVLDVAGLAQRNGPVTSHVRIADRPEQLHATRIAVADLIIGSDIVVTASRDVIGKIAASRTRAVVNSHVAPTSAFASNPDLDLSAQSMQEAIAARAGEHAVEFIAATELAYALLGNEVAANLFLVGYALQRGWLPVSLAALERAIELNAVAADMNRASLAWGRLAAHDPAAVQRFAERDSATAAPVENLHEVIERNAAELERYQDAGYAERYRRRVEHARLAEREIAGGGEALALAVARHYYKLLAYKDEYEVARLYSAPEFMASLREEFDGDFSIEFNMAPPLLQRRDPRTGRYKKRTFGRWMLHGFKALARLKRLRGTVLDPFGYSHHRRLERQLIVDYERTLEELLANLTADNHATAVEIAALPELIRGYDTVKERSIAHAKARREQLMAQFLKRPAARRIAVEVVP